MILIIALWVLATLVWVVGGLIVLKSRFQWFLWIALAVMTIITATLVATTLEAYK